MRVLWVFDALSPQMLALAAEVDRQLDIELQIITPHPLPAELAHLSAPAVVCRNKLDFRAMSQIRAHLTANRFDIAHAYTSRNMANLAGACWRLPSAPRLVGYRGTIGRLSRLDPANWITFWHPRFSRINCVCQATRDALIASGIPAQKLETVWEGCAPEKLTIRSRQDLVQYGIPADAFVIGAVANARPVKGIDILMRAAIELSGTIDVYWVVVGEIIDPKVSQLAQDPRLQGRVKLIGPQGSGGGYCGLFDIYVAPSRKEGLSMGIMEAMSQGSCPIVTEVGGNPELVRHEVDGIVVPPEDPQALGAAILELWGDSRKRSRYAASAQRRAAETFSIAAWSERLCTVYRSVVSTVEYRRLSVTDCQRVPGSLR